MTESTDSPQERPSEVLMAVLEETGATEVLGEALLLAELEDVPDTREQLFHFVDGPLDRALVGSLHPSTAANIIATVRERLAAVDKSGTRMKSALEDEAGMAELAAAVSGADSMAKTVPPPAGDGDANAYDDLVSGAIHSRVTPAWGIRTVDPNAPPGSTIWVVISNDSKLQTTALQKAPAGVDVVSASSMAVLNGAIKRSASKSSAIVLDAGDPSIKLDRAIAALTTEVLDMRIIVWRMEQQQRDRLIEAIPVTQTWLPCEAEVTPAEIMQLLGL